MVINISLYFDSLFWWNLLRAIKATTFPNWTPVATPPRKRGGWCSGNVVEFESLVSFFLRGYVNMAWLSSVSLWYPANVWCISGFSHCFMGAFWLSIADACNPFHVLAYTEKKQRPRKSSCASTLIIQVWLFKPDRSGVKKVSGLQQLPVCRARCQSTRRVPSPGNRPVYNASRFKSVRLTQTRLYI